MECRETYRFQHGRRRPTRGIGMITYYGSKYFQHIYHNNITSKKTTIMTNTCWIFALFLLTTTTGISAAREHFNGDVTPEEFVIDQLAALLQQHHLRQQQEQQREEAAAAAAAAAAAEREEAMRYSAEPGGPGFSYHFPPLPGGRESQHEPYFAINPSDPRFYRPSSQTIDETNDDAFLAEPSWSGGNYFPSEHGLVEEREEVAGRALRVPGGGSPVRSDLRTMEMQQWPRPDVIQEEKEENEETTTVPLPRPNMILHPRKPTHEPDHEPLPDTHARILQEPAPLDDPSDIYFAAIVAGCSAAGVITVIATGLCWYKLQRNAKAAADVEYPAYGVTGPNKDASPTNGDRRLAQSAQMYHYQHQKQQIIAMESRVANDRRGSMSEAESDEENEEGDYTVYECPGLAPTGEMEVKNPLFLDDPTPATPATPATPRSDDKSSDSGKKSPSTGSSK